MATEKGIGKHFLSAEDAISLLPDRDYIHTFYNAAFGLVGADWSREDIVDKVKKSKYREITGPGARKMNHGLAVYDVGAIHNEILFIETDTLKVDLIDPPVEGA